MRADVGPEHYLSKSARIRLLGLVLSRMSQTDAAEILGVSPAMVSKYEREGIAPSDRVTSRMLSFLLNFPETRDAAAKVIADDIATAVQELLGILPEDLRKRVAEQIIETIAPRAKAVVAR